MDRGYGFLTASVIDPFGNILGIMTNPYYLEILLKRQEPGSKTQASRKQHHKKEKINE
jgi:hypothetical protein